jgi:hypothetical protein
MTQKSQDSPGRRKKTFEATAICGEQKRRLFNAAWDLRDQIDKIVGIPDDKQEQVLQTILFFLEEFEQNK